MKNSWNVTFRRLAAGCAVLAASGWHSAMCYAAVRAYDDPSDPVYANGWQGITHAGTAGGGAQLTNGDNGGFGFSAWNFDSAYVSPGGFNYGNGGLQIKDIVPGGGFNSIGTAWRQATNSTSYTNRAGRGFSPLEIGETLEVVIDNPTKRQFFKGYFIRLNGAAAGPDGKGINGNICNKNDQACTAGAPTPVQKMYFSMFDYFTYGEWAVVDTGNPDFTLTDVFDTDTSASGARFSVTRTGANTYDVLMDPLGAGPSFTASRSFANPGTPINWIEFTFFNPFTETPVSPPGDYNNRVPVDAADYVIWRKMNGTGFDLQNEVPGVSPGEVTEHDYEEWKKRFGDFGPTPQTDMYISSMRILTASGAGAAVPEPNTFIGLIVASAGLFMATSRRARTKSHDPASE